MVFRVFDGCFVRLVGCFGLFFWCVFCLVGFVVFFGLGWVFWCPVLWFLVGWGFCGVLFCLFFFASFFRTAPGSIVSQPVLMHEAISAQVQKFSHLAEFNEDPVCSVPMKLCEFRFFC